MPLHWASLRSASRIPSLLRGHAAMGRPWPSATLAASMLLNPLHNNYIWPAGKGRWRCSDYRVRVRGREQRTGNMQVSRHCFASNPALGVFPNNSVIWPVRRLSGGVVELGIWQGRQMSHQGTGTSLDGDQRNGAGTGVVLRSKTRMPGALSLWLLFSLRKQRESHSP